MDRTRHLSNSIIHLRRVRLDLVLVVDPLIRHRHGDALKLLRSVLVDTVKMHGKVAPLFLHPRQLLADRPQDVVSRLHGLKELIHLLLVDVAAVRKGSALAL